jgi:hypothetical protein
MTYHLTVKGPLGATEGSPTGSREYWEMASGRLTGARINASITMPGGDWMIVSSDRFGRPDVRTQFVTDDGALILLRYTGLVERTEAFKGAGGTDGAINTCAWPCVLRPAQKNTAGSMSIYFSRKGASPGRTRSNTESIGCSEARTPALFRGIVTNAKKSDYECHVCRAAVECPAGFQAASAFAKNATAPAGLRRSGACAAESVEAAGVAAVNVAAAAHF